MILNVQQEPEQEEEEEQQEQEFTWIAAASQASPCIPSLCTMALGCRLDKYCCYIIIIAIITIHICCVILFLLSIATKLRSTAFDNSF